MEHRLQKQNKHSCTLLTECARDGGGGFLGEKKGLALRTKGTQFHQLPLSNKLM